MSDIEQRLREAMDGVTPGKWKAVVWKHSGGSDTVCIKDSRDREIIAWPGFDGVPCTKAEIRANARFIAAARNNIGALLDTIVSLRSKLEEAEGARDRLMRAAYLAGFHTSGEGYNAEYPFEGEDIEDDKRWCEGRDLALASLREADHA